MLSGATFGLPSRSPPIQLPKASGRALRRQLEPEPAELVGQLLEHVGHRVGVQAVEVPDRVARLVHHVGLRDAQLVGLPQQVDRSPRAAPSCAGPPAASRSAIWRSL